MELLQDNLTPLILAIMALLEVVVRLTPTKKDNTVLEVVQRIISIFIPNRKKGGGKF